MSELVIVGAAFWSVWRLGRVAMWSGAIGALIFGLIAFVGALRFGLGEVDAWQGMHQAASQIGGAAAMALVAMQLVLATGRLGEARGLPLAIGLGLATGLLAGLFRESATIIFIVWLLTAIFAAWSLPANNVFQRVAAAAIVAVLLVNVLLIRKSAMLSEGASWHLFHLLLAFWLVTVSVLLYRQGVAAARSDKAALGGNRT
ncbi:hypothetical protein [Erythrobacter sp. Dej080120_24]|uniref:hypothetical protein n=1 Tax=Erythrobacter sp. Dej080120_24 TaxID=3024837 RepID=UPI0030C76B24